MAKVKDKPVDAQEAPQRADLTPEQVEALARENVALKGLLRGLATDLDTLRVLILKVIG